MTLTPGMPGYEKLKRSLEQFDLVQPIVWNRRTGHVVAGHQRLTILKEQGVAQLDVVTVDLPLDEEKTLNVALNNPRIGGDWDPDKLITLLEELRTVPEIDETLTGFSSEELKALVLAPDPAFTPDGAAAGATSYRVSFEIDQKNWDSVRPALDRLMAEFDLEPHIRPPRS